MLEYAFGAGGFKLGERVEILVTGQRGILIAEIVHLSGCNTYQILLPSIISYGKAKVAHRDHLLLRKLNDNESIFDKSIELTDDNSFSPKGVDINANWINGAIEEEKEHITEIDDAVGIEEISIRPGMEVWSKVYGKKMVVTHICRDIYSKALEYGLLYMIGDSDVTVYARAYALVPLENKIDVPPAKKLGSIFEDGRDSIIFRSKFLDDAPYLAL